MPHLTTNGVSLAYDDIGPRAAEHSVILVHGFASNRIENWRRVGWLGAFERRGMRAIAFDMRGHGESDKPHEPDAYSASILISDILAVMDAREVRSATLMGYSMGARLALGAALQRPERFDLLILGGVGGRIFDPPPAANAMAEAMETESPDALVEPLLLSFRQFADEQGDDRHALAAFARARGDTLSRAALAELRAPTLVVAGAHDALAGDPQELAAAIPGARSAQIPGCDHFSAIAHVLFKAAVFDFLEDLPC